MPAELASRVAIGRIGASTTTPHQLSAASPHRDPWQAATCRTIETADSSGDALLAAIAGGLAAVTMPWELSTGEVPDGRRYEQLLATDAYDVWLIYWPPGTGLDAHDHGGSRGAFSVVAGTLEEDAMVDGRTVTNEVGPGGVVHFDESHVHAVSNRGAIGATSVHVYSPPLAAMNYYGEIEGMRVVNSTDAGMAVEP